MALALGRDVNDPLALIRQWQKDTSPEAVPDELGLAGRLYTSCVSLYRIILPGLEANSGLSTSSYRGVERSYGSLCLWGKELGVPEGNLDRLLDKSPSLRRSTLKLLATIGKTLSTRLVNLAFLARKPREKVLRESKIAVLLEEAACARIGASEHSENVDDTDSDSPSDYEDDSFQDITIDLRTDTDCLMDLLTVYQCPALDTENEEDPAQPLTADPRVPSQYYADRIAERFPNADISLVNRFGEANWKRFLRGRDEREVNSRKVTDPLLEPSSDPTVMESKFHDSGLGESVPSARASSAYAETITSFYQADGCCTRIPPLSEEAKKGKPFECIACGKTLRISHTPAWKKHLYLDLQPYICYQQSCSYNCTAFKNREQWIEHIGLEHGLAPSWRSQICPLCCEETGDGKLKISIHIASHLEEIALAALPTASESEQNSEAECSETESEDSATWQPHPSVGVAPWLNKAVAGLRMRYPDSGFEAYVRIRPASPDPDVQESQPRIRCNDCTGKLYRIGPGLTLDNFEVHLRSRQLMERVNERLHDRHSNDSESKTPDETTRCVCGMEMLEGDGFGRLIQCDACEVWQHTQCVGFSDESECPDEYFCEQCRPDLHRLVVRLIAGVGNNGMLRRQASHYLRLAAQQNLPSEEILSTNGDKRDQDERNFASDRSDITRLDDNENPQNEYFVDSSELAGTSDGRQRPDRGDGHGGGFSGWVRKRFGGGTD